MKQAITDKKRGRESVASRAKRWEPSRQGMAARRKGRLERE